MDQTTSPWIYQRSKSQKPILRAGWLNALWFHAATATLLGYKWAETLGANTLLCWLAAVAAGGGLTIYYGSMLTSVVIDSETIALWKPFSRELVKLKDLGWARITVHVHLNMSTVKLHLHSGKSRFGIAVLNDSAFGFVDQWGLALANRLRAAGIKVTVRGIREPSQS